MDAVVLGDSLQSLPPSPHCLSEVEGLLRWWRGEVTAVPGVQEARAPPEPICKPPGPLAFHPGSPCATHSREGSPEKVANLPPAISIWVNEEEKLAE